jgi:hypothetical protein
LTIPQAFAGGWATRLRAVFGAPVDQITEAHVQGIVDQGVREDADLDFKAACYGNDDQAKRELAADIAAMANDRGGLIVIGVREENDVAVERKPVRLDSGEEGRMRSIAASNVAPYAPFDILTVESAAAPHSGYYLLVVPPSAERPHAVRKGIDLRYPRRHGTTKRWLAESEVADAYRDRFSRATSDVGRIDEVMREGLAVMEQPGAPPRIAFAIVPSQRGSFEIDAPAVRRVEDWARREPQFNSSGNTPFRGPWGGLAPSAGVGVRRVRLGSAGATGLDTTYVCADLHTDGCVFVGRQFVVTDVQAAMRAPSDQPATVEQPIHATHLAQHAVACLVCAARLSMEMAGAFGDCVVRAALVGNQMRLIEAHPDGYPTLVGGTVTSVMSSHTVTLDSIATISPNLLITARLISADIVQAFGEPELSAISTDGEIRIGAFPMGYHTPLREWAEHHRIAMSE